MQGVELFCMILKVSSFFFFFHSPKKSGGKWLCYLHALSPVGPYRMQVLQFEEEWVTLNAELKRYSRTRDERMKKKILCITEVCERHERARERSIVCIHSTGENKRYIGIYFSRLFERDFSSVSSSGDTKLNFLLYCVPLASGRWTQKNILPLVTRSLIWELTVPYSGLQLAIDHEIVVGLHLNDLSEGNIY